jgi:mono/diheme cytochrome c family protein
MFPAVVATAAFVIAFVVLGLAVVLLAMRGGPRGVRESMHGQSRGGSRAWGIALGLVLIVFGAAIPVLIASANNNDSEKHGRGGATLTSSAAHGRVIFARNCATCHTLAGSNSVGKVGPNLDELRPPHALILNAIKVGRAQGRGQMPAELVDGQDAKDVAAYVTAVAGR